MAYFFSKYNNVIKVIDNVVTLVPMQEGHPEHNLFLEFLQTDVEVKQSELFSEEEEIQINTPSEVALWKLRFILSQMNLESAITGFLNELPEPQKTAANYIWNYGNTIDRHSPTILYLQTKLNLTDTQVNQIFINANQIVL